MNDRKCKVLLLSGFLGSGKTTLLRELLENPPDGETLVVLMNEFGRIGVDGDVVRREGLEVMEINRGSIFCACAKGDFLRALHTILRDYRPGILLIEASGVADTRDMKRDLGLGRLGDFFELRGNLCVVDAEHFADWADLFNAVPRQVEAATLIVLNKIDLVAPESLPELRRKIRELNAEAPLYETSFGRIPWERILPKEEPAQAVGALPSSKDWDAFIEERLKDASAHLTPPDAFYPQSILWEGDPQAFRRALSDLPDDLVRAKGFFREGEGWMLFDIVRGRAPTYASLVRDSDGAEPNLAVFIRREDRPQEIPKRLVNAGLKLKGIRN